MYSAKELEVLFNSGSLNSRTNSTDTLSTNSCSKTLYKPDETNNYFEEVYISEIVHQSLDTPGNARDTKIVNGT